MIKRSLFPIGVLAALAAFGSRAAAQDDVLQQIRSEAQQKSQVMKFFDQLVTVIGPRLTGSPEYKAAADWSRDTLASFGMTDSRLEPFEFGRGWTLDKLVIEMVEPRYMPLHGYAEAWSASTKGELLAAPVFVGDASVAEVTSMKTRLAGGIILSQPMVQTFVREDRVQPTTSDAAVRPGAPAMPRQPNANPADARQVTQLIREAGPGVLIRTSAGEHGTVFVLGRDQGENAVPSVVLAAEHYNMVARMLAAGMPVKLRVNVQTRFLTTDTKSYNVLAEIPGTDPKLKDEVVLLGAHLDSWHTAPGATDNADGTAAAIESMRILKTIGVKPRRTIRVALWGGEEEGLLGSRAHVRAHYAGEGNAAARDKLAIYLNLDPGMGPIYGWYLENSAPARALFDKWIEPLKDLGVRRNMDPGIGNTDHVSFREAGMPGFNAVQDYDTYDVRTHHTNVDTYERVREEDLKQNAVVLAWVVYNAAMTDQRVPPPAAVAR
ncbi:MAG: M20/M25/M40 family metallo-hydrolase [Acidobacteriota bacterium]|nr:M20/M25/M40 family metallo-hydrolase [Acidobacteriota bacterium]MDQ3417667.1 M20/M25/M40 family metallo-hydrolase [Acidobacteriota bacterium]